MTDRVISVNDINRISDLRPGDIVRSRTYGMGYVVHAVDGDTATVVRILSVTNPSDWRVVREEMADD